MGQSIKSVLYFVFAFIYIYIYIYTQITKSLSGKFSWGFKNLVRLKVQMQKWKLTPRAFFFSYRKSSLKFHYYLRGLLARNYKFLLKFDIISVQSFIRAFLYNIILSFNPALTTPKAPIPSQSPAHRQHPSPSYDVVKQSFKLFNKVQLYYGNIALNDGFLWLQHTKDFLTKMHCDVFYNPDWKSISLTRAKDAPQALMIAEDVSSAASGSKGRRLEIALQSSTSAKDAWQRHRGELISYFFIVNF